MAKKLLLSREREIPTSQQPAIGNVGDTELDVSQPTLELIPNNTDVGISAPIIDSVSELDNNTTTPNIDLVTDESNSDMPIPLFPQPSVSTVRDSVPVSIRSTVVSEEDMELPFDISGETSKTFSKYNTTGRSSLIKFKPPIN
jgi:hypothetical protein